jgi:transcriptional regulator GlxA family with amidase domain
VEQLQGSELAGRILKTLTGAVPPNVLAAFRFCLSHAGEPLTVDQVAAGCGVKRRALEYRFWKAGLRPPAACLMRCRLLLVVHELERRHASVERLALEQGFGSAGALRKAFARHFGTPPRTFRSAGAFEAMLPAFVQEIRRPS